MDAELAERLALFLWNDLPDPSAVQQLVDRPIEDVAREMLGEERARQGVESFFTWWLRLNDLESLPRDDPDGVLTPETVSALSREPAVFGAYVVFDGEGTFEQLLTAPFTLMNSELATIYGLSLAGQELRPVDYPHEYRRGIFGTAGALARYSSTTATLWPPRRYWMLADTLWCHGVGGSVPPAFGNDPPQDPMLLREELDFLTQSPGCPICHDTINPISYGFLAFDNIGRFIDPALAQANEIVILNNEPILSFEGGQPGLMRALLEHPDSRRCFAEQLLVYGVDRNGSDDIETDTGVLVRKRLPELDSIARDLADAFDRTGGDIKELLVTITTTPEFIEGRLPR